MPKIKIENVTKIFGKKADKALELLEQKKSKQDILRATGATVGVNNVSLSIEEGEIFVIMGLSGSGKSTLAKHINGLLVPTEGTLWVDHMNTASDADIWNIRQKAGMVFQNPDNQIIGTVVEEDVGFGPENLGVPTEDIWKRVDESLKEVGMTA